MGFCYGEGTVDVGQTMGLKAPLVWVTPSTSINNYELKAQRPGRGTKTYASRYTRKSGSGRDARGKAIRKAACRPPGEVSVGQDPTRHA